MEKEENDTYFHEIEGLDAAPKMNLLKMVQEQRKEYMCKQMAVLVIQTIFVATAFSQRLIIKILFGANPNFL